MAQHLNIIGFLLMALALIHVIFPRYFDWKNEFGRLSLINRQMIYVHTFFIALAVLLTGLMCVTSSVDLISTRLGNRIALGLFLFWFIRLIIQFLGYSSQLWKGKIMETVIHILFIIFWTYLSAVFFMVYWMGRNI